MTTKTQRIRHSLAHGPAGAFRFGTTQHVGILRHKEAMKSHETAVFVAFEQHLSKYGTQQMI